MRNVSLLHFQNRVWIADLKRKKTEGNMNSIHDHILLRHLKGKLVPEPFNFSPESNKGEGKI